MRLDAHFGMLPDRAFEKRGFGRSPATLEGGGKGGGGGGAANQTVTTSNVPDWARPGVESLIQSGMKNVYPNMTPVYKKDEAGNPTTEIESYNLGEQKGYSPFSATSTSPAAQQALEAAQSTTAGFNPLQNQVFGEAGAMRTPGQFAGATGLAGAAGQGALDTVGGANYYGGMGSEYGAQGAGIGMGALGYGQAGAGLGQQAARAGQQYARQATSPGAVSAYMSPYMQNAVDVQKQQAIRDYQEQMPALQAQAVKAGAFGGTRDAVQRAMANRSLNQQLQNIQAQGTQSAYDKAIQSMQYGSNLGLQGLQTGIQGQQTGLQGIQGALAGTAQGMQGAGLGLQGVGAAQAGYGLAGQQATNLANIGAQQQASDLARLQAQAGYGATQQQQQQNILNQAMANYNTMQNYPMSQLAQLESLYTGAPQNITQTGYQAAPSTVSQVAGLGALGYGLSRMAKGGEVKTKKMGIGGITSIDRKVLNNPMAFSAKTISDGINDGSISKMVGAIALDALKNKPKAPAQTPQGTILSELEAQATPGIPSLPTNLPTVGAAGGGIIAFEDGGDVKGYDGTDGESQVKDPWGQGLVNLWKRYTWGSPEALERQGAFTSEQATKAREQENLIKKQVSEGNEAFLSGKLDKKPDEKPGIVIHDDKKPNAPAAPPSPKGVDYSQEYAGINDLLKEYTGLIRGTMGDEAQKKEDAKTRFITNLGLGMLGGTSPYAAQNVSKAGLEATAEYQKEMNQNEALKRQAVGQLVNLGIKGVELKSELKKLGITEDYYKAHAPLFAAQANYYGARAANPPGAGGSIGSPTALKMWQEYKGQLSDPVSSPVFKSLDKTTQKFLQKADPSSPSYKEAYKVFKKALDDEFGSSVQFMRAVGTKGQASTAED